MRRIVFTLMFISLISVKSYAWDVSAAALGQWKLNDNAANSTVTDSADSLGGTLFKPGSAVNTSVVSTTGKISLAFLFDGTVTTYGVDIGNHASLGFSRTTPWAVAGWFKTSDTTHEGAILSRIDNSASAAGWSVEISSGKIQVLIISTVSSNWIQQLSTSTYNNNTWHFLVVNYSGSSTAAGITLYIDGAVASKASPTADTLSSAISYTNALPAIGIRNSATGGSSQPFFGPLDDVMVFNRVLTTDEIAGLYNCGTGVETLSGTTPTCSSGGFFNLL